MDTGWGAGAWSGFENDIAESEETVRHFISVLDLLLLHPLSPSHLRKQKKEC